MRTATGPRSGVPARVLLVAAVLAAVTAASIAMAPDREGFPRWVPGTPPTSGGWPVGTFGCDSNPWGQYVYPVADPDDEVYPQSPPAVQGRPYCIEVPHCGLDWITDFDGSFWKVVAREPARPGQIFGEGVGSITLTAPDRAEFTPWFPGRVRARFRTAVVDYEGQWGSRVTLHRLASPIVVAPCA